MGAMDEPRRRLRAALKRAVRTAGVATASVRPDPDFLVIGAKRGGSTSLYFDLLDHPSYVRLYPPPVPGLKDVATKGVHFFDSHHLEGMAWYRSYMPTRFTRSVNTWRHGTPSVVGEASPYYLFHPSAAQRAHEALPDVKVVALLRDPVERTYSHWKERRRAGAEELDFVAALDAEPGRLAGERERLLADPAYRSYAWEQQSYLTQSRYAEALRPWLERYGRDRVLVAASEDYYADPLPVLRTIDDFLGVPPRDTSTGAVRNQAPGAPLEPEVRARLQAAFVDANRDLEELLGQRLPWTTT
ncbi:sulfotransferase domain-containing protein [Nocardioides dongxiaopingii]|uniref:sulfotransferase domain-containing protein n=1 Tax=Nocardioides dongxiaopingii TaxID=2576036 RepID=UPI0014854BD3|nr:sulfotransferase domain-containing protein [Nocardioides dongxiaopingii]